MSTYTDEPVLVKPDAKSKSKFFAFIGAAALIAGIAIYIPVSKERMEKRAHYAERGEFKGTLLKLSLDGAPHTLELAWGRGGFAPILRPAPAEGVTLFIQSRKGSETLTWNTEGGCFGPTKFEADPYGHYKVTLRLQRGDAVIWSDKTWAYGIHEHHGHSH